MQTLQQERLGTGDAAPTAVAEGCARLERFTLDVNVDLRGVLRALGEEPGLFALSGSWAGGGAIVGCAPLTVAGEDADPFDLLDNLPAVEGSAGRGRGAADASAHRDRGSPEGRADRGRHVEGAVGGGWFGWLGYHLGSRVERIPPGPPRPVALPDFHLAYYDHVLRLDSDGHWWFEALVTPAREAALDERLRELRARLAAPAPPARPERLLEPLRLSDAARAHHLDAVRDCRRRIIAGEIYQANICLRLEGAWSGTAGELFERALGELDPPHAALFQTEWGGVASLSPELFLRRTGDQVLTAPIKGTIARAADPAAAERARATLEASGKDAAEHVMIVDLMRNDIGRVCRYGSVVAARRPTVEPHPGLWHLVTPVTGRLRPGAGDGDLLRATFPPGSVTGAPKVQAMHVIAELEPTGREVYTGAIGFASPVAGLELNVAIRTLELRDGRLWMGAGGGIVADSDPERELEEALLKAAPIAAAVGTEVVVEPPPVTSPSPTRPDREAGVFETLLVRDGRVQALGRHLGRLAGSLAELYGEDLDRDGAAARARQAAGESAGTQRLRIDALPERPGVTLRVSTSAVDLVALGAPVTLFPLNVPGGLGAHKWRDRRLLEQHPGVPLILDGDEVLEAAWANVWIVEAGRLLTPPADGRILPGVTRAMLLELGPEHEWTVEEAHVSVARARAADAVFLTSSIRHAVVARWGERPQAQVGGAEPPASDALGPAEPFAMRTEVQVPGSAASDEVIARVREALAAAEWPSRG